MRNLEANGKRPLAGRFPYWLAVSGRTAINCATATAEDANAGAPRAVATRGRRFPVTVIL